ncbi:hypothetical protein AK812_SmicGene26215 [Symbiodinium microadriaticum]|uniref:SMB domain-containing protein n=1 Tax=Symbiodinium microadriaticum TaxID=2951 RepID=A0A1Q9DA74_SYMMI|nr:hypothetical protein AK812_SmicGene26215 [Symbiodinium microadriaticum]
MQEHGTLNHLAITPGSDGHCGGAIYFALSPQATKTKAIGNDSKSGCMIEVKVDVGRVKYEGSRCGHKWTKQEFLQTGYDSIRFDPGDGDELVIYDSSRVKSMRIIPFNNAWRGDLNTQEGSAGLKVRKANQTGRANDSLATKADFHEPLLLPPNVSGQEAPHSAEAGASPSNATAFRPSFKSAAGWVGCWYYGCHGSYHPEFQCQCNKDCGRFRNCCYDYGTCWQTPDSRRRRRRDPSSSNSRPTHTNMVTGFHQTSPNVCKLIVNSAFRPGSDGHCGGAIYFALSPQATKTKAIGNDSKSGCMIEVKVDVGRVKYEGSRCGHKWTKQEFLQTGYDSIRFDPGDGDELVIYDS